MCSSPARHACTLTALPRPQPATRECSGRLEPAGTLTSRDQTRRLCRFLPDLPAALLTPATVSDDSDGQLAHLRGLNLSRAYCWLRLAAHLPPGDPRAAVMRAAAQEHAARELDQVSGGDYLVEHWLACYAVLYLTA